MKSAVTSTHRAKCKRPTFADNEIENVAKSSKHRQKAR